MKSIKKRILGYISAVLLTSFIHVGNSSALTLELALVVDGSGSINAAEWQTQMLGYQSVFSSGTFYDDYVATSVYDSIVVGVYQFGTFVQEEIAWTEITNNADATAFGNLFLGITQDAGWTNTVGGINAAMDGIMTNSFAGDNFVMDISTDGYPTVCADDILVTSLSCDTTIARADAIAAADAARANGITVNALGVGDYIDPVFLTELVSGDPDGFYMQTAYADFGTTLELKIGREIAGVPEPATILLLGLGLLGFAAQKRKKV